MADSYSLNIAQLERHLPDGTVFTVHWTLTAQREVEGQTFSSGSYGSVGLSQPDPENFIPFDELTKETVLQWTKERLGGDEKLEEMEAGLSAGLDEQEFPSKAQGLPWS